MQFTPEQEEQIVKELQRAFAAHAAQTPKELEFKAYYDEDGKIITYTTEDLPGDYIVITRDQFNLARHDARVIKGKLVYVHLLAKVFKMTKDTGGTHRVNRLDMSILADEDDTDVVEYSYLSFEEEPQ